MTLAEQLFAFGYHLIMGQLYAFLFSFLSMLCLSFSSWLRSIVYAVFSLLLTSLFYYGLYHINGGVTHFYLMIIFLTGIYLYYHFFYELLLPLFIFVKKVLKPLEKKIKFAKKKIYGIISSVREKRRRLKQKDEQRKKK